MKKAWLYGRDSLKTEFPASQIEKLKQYADDNQMEIAGISFDTCGWKTLDCKGLNRAVQAIAENEAEVILVPYFNRITRSIGGAKAFAELLANPDCLVIADRDDAMAWDAVKSELRKAESHGMVFGTF